MDKNMNKDDFMNDLYDYLWMPEDEQGSAVPASEYPVRPCS